MPDLTQQPGWYEITKDIIIPILSIIATIVIGIIIAGLLKRKEEKAKIKGLLIDNYMKYLNKKINFAKQEQLIFTHWLYEEMCIDHDGFFGRDANSHIPSKLIRERRDKLHVKLESLNDDDANWSPFTFQFCFLLGTKIYRKEAQSLENNIIRNYIDDDARKKFMDEIKAEVKSDTALVAEINSLNESKIKKALATIEHNIAVRQNEFQRKNFQPYDNKIADLIDAY